jgi:rhodanese-related sulfurtransferase
MWVGALITDLKQPILFVAEPGREEEVVTRLARVGYDNPIGYLDGGFDAWKAAGEEVDTMDQVTGEEFAKHYNKDFNLLDVRKESEYAAEHIVDAANFPLDFINRNMNKLDRNKRYYLHCAGGYRSMIAASILRSRGFENLVNIQGGYKELVQTDLKRTEYVEQITEL